VSEQTPGTAPTGSGSDAVGEATGLRGRLRGWRNVHDWVLLALVTGFALSFASTSWPPLLVSLPVAAGILLLDKRKRSRAAASSGA